MSHVRNFKNSQGKILDRPILVATIITYMIMNKDWGGRYKLGYDKLGYDIFNGSYTLL